MMMMMRKARITVNHVAVLIRLIGCYSRPELLFKITDESHVGHQSLCEESG